MRLFEREHGAYRISTDPGRFDMDAICGFILDAYWARGVTRPVLERAIAGSLAIGAYAPDGSLAGFARVITDGALFAYLRDVFVLPAHRGQGLGRALGAFALDHPDLATVRNWMLATRDAHGVYAALGFGPPTHPEMIMQKRRTPDADTTRAVDGASPAVQPVVRP